MRYRKFGNTGLMVSEIGFGAWAIGGGAMIGNTAIGWGNADDNESKAAIQRSVELGINFFDTADIYGLGHSEQLIGEVLGNKKDVIIATKVGNVSRNEQFTVDYSKEYIVKACEKSLKRLKRDAIDYYQLHTARLSHLQQGDCLEAMSQLQQQGKIRYWGISLNTFDPFPEAEFFMQQKTGNGFQLVLNMLNQKALPLVKKASQAGYGIIARMPLQFGLLTGKFDDGVSFPENDHRKNRVTREIVEATNRALAPAWELCHKYGITKTELALSYILSYAEVSTVIPGIRTTSHAEKNVSEIIQLSVEDRILIEQLGTGPVASVMDLVQKQG
ncbi:aldo/keto reductase [Terrimonas alba]|uniref:aldo/keto reductase n=1 Tax=Terrimonas alba TaxID=3349636 RepID=UPI0035F4DB6A